ncbi:MAG: S8 family serine peptidase [Gemmatimonadetes bacterium]|nr:S8 family serine peptidase [Gemmatimonadota bacterium]
MPALDLRTVAGELPRALSDGELVRQVALADGNVLIGLKPLGAPRSRISGVVAAMDRAMILDARSSLRRQGVQITRAFRRLRLVAARITPSAAPTLRALTNVDFLEADIPGRAQSAPQDPSWCIRKAHAPIVWDGQRGPPSRGECVFVSILDTGLDPLNRLSGQAPIGLALNCLSAPPSNGTPADSSCYDHLTGRLEAWSGVPCTGTVSAPRDADGLVGVAPALGGFESITVCLGVGTCLPGSIAGSLDWILSRHRPRQVVNMSIGLSTNYASLQQSVAALVSAGVHVVAAVGNRWQFATLQDACGPHGNDVPDGATSVIYPARYPGVIAVTGITQNDQFAYATNTAPPTGGGEPPPLPDCSWTGCDPAASGCEVGSRYGNEATISAPFAALGEWRDGATAYLCGTSMAAPRVAGVAALIWSSAPGWPAAQVAARLAGYTDPLSPQSLFGTGRLNALQAAFGIAAPPRYSGSIEGPSSVQPGATCGFSATGNSPNSPFTFAWSIAGDAAGCFESFHSHTLSVPPGTTVTLRASMRDGLNWPMEAVMPVLVSTSAAACCDC